MADRIHVYPINRRTGKTEHWTGKAGLCWCLPEERQACSESDDKGHCVASCWRCAGSGLVEPYCDEWNILIIHREGARLCYPDMPDNALGAR